MVEGSRVKQKEVEPFKSNVKYRPVVEGRRVK